jgi:GH35 family endo-1,4-beta-xylanase
MLDELETAEKNELYKKYFKEGFNAATLPFYWSDLEPEQGKPRFAKDSKKIYRRPAPDLCLEFCEENGITPRGHCLTYVNFTPKWLDVNDVPNYRRALEKRYKEIAERYSDKIHSWDVINELYCTEAERGAYYESDNVLNDSFDLAEKYFRPNELTINEATDNVWGNGHFAFSRSGYYLMIEKALREGRRIDCVGMQCHAFVKKENEGSLTSSIYNPKRIFDVLDRYEKLGLPILITEITIPCYSPADEDKEIQAEILTRLFEIWFSHRAVEGAIYWNLVDGYAAWAPQGDMTAGENYFYGGLVDFDFNPKPSYYAIKKLFTEKWTTNESLIADENGNVTFKGFFGEYEVTVDGKTYSFNASSKHKNEITLTV